MMTMVTMMTMRAMIMVMVMIMMFIFIVVILIIVAVTIVVATTVIVGVHILAHSGSVCIGCRLVNFDGIDCPIRFHKSGRVVLNKINAAAAKSRASRIHEKLGPSPSPYERSV